MEKAAGTVDKRRNCDKNIAVNAMMEPSAAGSLKREGERCEPSAEAAAQATPERPVRSGTDDPPLAGMLRGRSAPERACSGDQGGTVVMIRP